MMESNDDTPWTVRVITLLPEAFPGILGHSITGRALARDIWRLEVIDLRQFGIGKHRMVDDTPAGGGAGMVMRADVVGAALEAAGGQGRSDWPLIIPTPRGSAIKQSMVHEWANARGITIFCGRFEGIDERILDSYQPQEVSMGDFVLSGGEICAQALIDATLRLIPRVLGNQESLREESFSEGLLEYPHYTRPANWEGRDVPEVLLSGHHKEISSWRRGMAERLTKKQRPDLWRAYLKKKNSSPDEA